VYEGQPGVVFARNRGVRETASPWIAFFDDDQVADPDWLKELLATARDKGAKCVGGANRLLLPEGKPPLLAPICRGLLGETAGGAAPCRYGGRNKPGAGNLLLHRDVFHAVGLFDEGRQMAGEDGELFRRMGAAGIEGWYTPRAIMHHVIPTYRVENRYLRWKSLGYGRNKAQRDWSKWHLLGVLPLMAARLAYSLAISLPMLAWAGLRRDAVATQGARCMLWRTEGYWRYALNRMAPWLFRQEAFLAQLEFRGERELFAPAEAPVEPEAAAVAAGGTP
jgi:hypothetical protein